MRKGQTGYRPHFFSLLLFLSVFIIASTAAAEDKLSPSCSASDIESTIESVIASGGGTIFIPACEAFGTWNSGDKVDVTPGDTEIRVLGQGETETKIGYAAGAQKGTMFKFRGPGLKEFGGMYLKGDGYTGGSGRGFLTLHATTNSRIHHVTTENFAGPTGSLCGTKNVVFDNCTFKKVLYSGTYHWYVYGDNSYPEDWTSRYGTENYNVFFEDCTFRETHHPVSTFTSGSAVIRYNTLSFASTSGNYTNVIDCHSCCYGDCPGDDEPYNWDSALDRSGRAYEIYNNTMEYTGSSGQSYFARIRAGSVLFTGNDIAATQSGATIGQGIQLVCEGNNNGPQCTSANGYPVDYTYSNGCNGATDGCCDKVQDSYIWNNGMTRVNDEITTYSVCGSGALAEGKDYFQRAPTMNQDGFVWTPYPYPHPLVTGDYVPPDTPEADPRLKRIDTLKVVE